MSWRSRVSSQGVGCQRPAPGQHVHLRDAVDFVLNDIAAGDAPDRLVADVLGDTAAVDLLLTLDRRLEAVIAKIGPHGAFAAANELPEWDQVRTAATALAGPSKRSQRRPGMTRSPEHKLCPQPGPNRSSMAPHDPT